VLATPPASGRVYAQPGRLFDGTGHVGSARRRTLWLAALLSGRPVTRSAPRLGGCAGRRPWSGMMLGPRYPPRARV